MQYNEVSKFTTKIILLWRLDWYKPHCPSSTRQNHTSRQTSYHTQQNFRSWSSLPSRHSVFTTNYTTVSFQTSHLWKLQALCWGNTSVRVARLAAGRQSTCNHRKWFVSVSEDLKCWGAWDIIDIIAERGTSHHRSPRGGERRGKRTRKRKCYTILFEKGEKEPLSVGRTLEVF